MKKKVRVRVHASVYCESNMYKLNVCARVCGWVGRVCVGVSECRSIRAAVSNMYKSNKCVYVRACVGVGARVSECRRIRASQAAPV